MEITKEDLIAVKKRLEKYKIPKVDGNYIIDLCKPDEATIKLINENKLFTIKKDS